MILKLGLVIDVALKVLHLNMHRHKTYKRPAWPCNVLAQKLQLLCRNICSLLLFLLSDEISCNATILLCIVPNAQHADQNTNPIQYCQYMLFLCWHSYYLHLYLHLILTYSPFGMALEMDTSVSFDFCWTSAFRKINFFETHFVLNWLNNT